MLSQIPFRIKVIALTFLLVFFSNLLIVIIIENLDFVNALYFLVVTMTTVGFGDITPHNTITKFSVITLIIVSILSLGYLSEFVLSNILTSKSIDLPSKGLTDKKHIIITPFNTLGQLLARLLFERNLLPVIIDNDSERINTARLFGLKAYKADSRLTEVLEKLNLQEAEAMYLLMEDDNDIIQTAILSKTFYHDLPIFAQLALQTAKDIDSHYMGITRSFNYEEIVSFTLQFYFNRYKYYVYDHQREPESILKFIEVSGQVNIKEEFPDAIVIGEIDNSLRTIDSVKELTFDFASNPDNHVLIGIPREKFDNYIDFKNQQMEYQHEKVIFGGFSKFIRDIMPLLSFPKEKILIVTFIEEELKFANEMGYKSSLISKKNIVYDISHLIKSNDIIINTFSSIVDSLLLIHTIEHLPDINPRIIQIIYQTFELRVFKNTGIYRIIMPDAFVARNMFIPLIRMKKMTTTFVFSFAHVFEHRVKKGDFFEDRRYLRLYKQGITILLIKKRNQQSFRKNFTKKMKIESGDYIIVAIRPRQAVLEKIRTIEKISLNEVSDLKS